MMRLKKTTEPAIDPVTAAEVKTLSRIDCSDEDDLITTLISVATNYVERWLGRQLISATYVLTMDELPNDVVKLPKPPLINVVSVTYVNSSGNRTGVSTSLYDVNTNGQWGEFYLAYNQSWPTDESPRKNGVEITYDAGYGSSADDVPEGIKQAIKMLAADMYERREAQVDKALMDNPVYKNLLWNYKAAEVV